MTGFAVEFHQVVKEFPFCRPVDGVTAAFEGGKIHAILGENGAGKTTLMKLLFGLLRPTEGTVSVFGKKVEWSSPAHAIDAGLGMVQQHFTLVDSLSVIDNIILGRETAGLFGQLDRRAAIADLESRIPSSALRLDWSRTVRDLSVGEKQKVEILKLIARDSKILVLDEPTAVLTPQEILELFDTLKKLRDSGRTIFVITHKLNEVFDHCDTWFALRAGKVTGSGRLRGEVGEGSSPIEMRRKIVRAMVGADVPVLGERGARPAGANILKFSGVTMERRSGGLALRDLSFSVGEGEILGVAGVDGSGQAEIVDALLGLYECTGHIELQGQAVRTGQVAEIRESGVALISEDRLRQALWPDETVELNGALGFENRFSRGQWIDHGSWRKAVESWLKNFDVRYPALDTEVRRLSGGNQQKLIFARELSGRVPKLIVAHQPTRGVDLGAVQQIHDRVIRLRDQGVAILLISSELDELMALSDRMIVLCAGKVTGEFRRQDFDRNQIGSAMTGGPL